MVTVIPSPIAGFTPNPQITDLNSPIIHFYDESVNAYAWLWSFGDANSNFSTEQFPEYTYDEPGNYPITQIVYNGPCTDTIIKYVLIREGFAYFIPNSFTPTTDHLNEVFNGKGIGYKTDDFELSIFDRWGEKIFNTTDSEKGWDGKMQRKDKVCMAGIYVYKFKLVELNGIEHKYVGTVLLLR